MSDCVEPQLDAVYVVGVGCIGRRLGLVGFLVVTFILISRGAGNGVSIDLRFTLFMQ